MKSNFDAIRDKIGEANLSEALEDLMVLADKSSYLNEIITIKSRLETINYNIRMGIVRVTSSNCVKYIILRQI